MDSPSKMVKNETTNDQEVKTEDVKNEIQVVDLEKSPPKTIDTNDAIVHDEIDATVDNNKVEIIDSDSNSDILVIDIDDEEVKKEQKSPPAEEAENDKKRKRKSSTEKQQPAKKSRRSSTTTSNGSVRKFDQVENELEAMFADENKEDIKDVKPVKTSKKPVIKKEKVEKSKKKPQAASRRKSTDAKKSTNSSGKNATENINQSEQEKLLDKFKGPFARVQGELNDIRWTNIINNATDILNPHDIPKNSELEQLSKVTGFGYNLTTLSSKYDPRNTDEAWICVFCRKPSHFNGLGDLFGPYFIPNTQWKALNMPSKKPTVASDLASSFILGGSDQAGAKAKKRQKRKSGVLDSSNTAGQQVSSPSKNTGQGEVWFHEDCICWMPQIRLMGCQILGIAEAIRVSQKSTCSKCHMRGSTLACSQLRCRETAHFICAQDEDWSIDPDDFLAKCQQHRN